MTKIDDRYFSAYSMYQYVICFGIIRKIFVVHKSANQPGLNTACTKKEIERDKSIEILECFV